MPQDVELLVVRDPVGPIPQAAQDAARALAVPVVGALPPRLFVVRAAPDAAAALAAVPGVRAVLARGPRPAEEEIAELTTHLGGAALDPREELFVRSWLAGAQPKHRPGDGAAWDDPRFEPPDLPAGRPEPPR